MVTFAIDPKKIAAMAIDLQNCNVEKSPIAAPLGLQVVDKLNLWRRTIGRPAAPSSGHGMQCAQTIQMWASWERPCLQWHRA
jgi:hypothetical protein